MRALAIVIISLLLLECFYYAETAPTWQPHPSRPKCQKPASVRSECCLQQSQLRGAAIADRSSAFYCRL
uniref:Putative 5.3 kDa protein n=1 Tax=Ixodes ricinus TaxID=34613 RepID=A0A0K8RFJ5_IXORI